MSCGRTACRCRTGPGPSERCCSRPAWPSRRGRERARSFEGTVRVRPDHIETGGLQVPFVDGPYQIVRHPIYLAMDLWALGSTLTCPAAVTLVGAAVIFIGGELRARAEERLLLEVFGETYRAYAGRVRRPVPGVY